MPPAWQVLHTWSPSLTAVSTTVLDPLPCGACLATDLKLTACSLLRGRASLPTPATDISGHSQGASRWPEQAKRPGGADACNASHRSCLHSLGSTCCLVASTGSSRRFDAVPDTREAEG
eukprot:GHUV01038928.1.p2 GENE.GHUV01038928.1~~GHUV01038928.1.p2  ORF type:complete len:119 (-),score=5.65 GHUV01038928.1:1413-1769(-)